MLDLNNILILGDVHLGKSMTLGKTIPGSFINSRVVDQLQLLDWTLDQALQENCAHIVITGDIFEDPKPHPTIITSFMSWLKKAQANNVEVHIIVGNHDTLRIGHSYTSPLDIISEADLEGIHVYHNIDTIFVHNSAITMLPFRDRKSLNCASIKDGVAIINDLLRYEVSFIPNVYKKVLIGHLAIEGSIFIGDEVDDISNEIFLPITTLLDYDFTWMGHVHKPQVIKKSPFISHIGSMDISNFGECEQEKYVVIYNPYSGDFFNKPLPTKSLRKVKIVIPEDTLDTTEYALSKLKEQDLSNSIVKIEVELLNKNLASVDKKRLEEYVLSGGANNVSGISETKKITSIKKDNNALHSSLDVKAAIKLYADTYVREDRRGKFTEISNELYQELISK